MHSGHSSGVATPSPGRPARAHHASEHSAVAPNSSGHAVDPIEKSAPAWGLDPTAPPTHPSPSTPAQPESAHHLQSSSPAPAQSAHVTKSEPAAAVLPWLDQSPAALLSDSPQQKPMTGHAHSLRSAIAAGPAVQTKSPVRPATQPESAVNSSLESSEPVASVRQADTSSQAAGAVGEWQGFASVDEGQDDDSNADWCDEQSAQGTGEGSAYKVDAVAEAPRLSQQQRSSGFDVISGRPTPDLIGLPGDKAVKAKQPIGEPSGERRSSGEPSSERRSSGEPNSERRSSAEPNSERRISGERRISKGSLHDAVGSRGYAANARRSSDQQRAQPSMQIPVPSPKLSGIARKKDQAAVAQSILLIL